MATKNAKTMVKVQILEAARPAAGESTMVDVASRRSKFTKTAGHVTFEIHV